MENSQDYGSQVSGNYSVDDNTVGSNDVVNSPEDNVVYVDASGGSKENYGGAIYNWIANSKISSSTFINNSATDNGGAIYTSAGNKGDIRNLNATDCVFTNNSAND